MGRTCCVRGCKNSRNGKSSLSFFKFPIKNENLFKQWRQVVPTDTFITQNSHICSDHFDKASFVMFGGVRHLHKNAIPMFSQKVKTKEPSIAMVVEVDYSLINTNSKNKSFVPVVLEDAKPPSTSVPVENPELLPNNMVVEDKSLIVKKDNKDIGTQVSSQQLSPSKVEQQLRLKIRRLQNKLKRRDNKIANVLHLLQELKKNGIIHNKLEEVLISKFSGLKLDIFKSKIRCISNSKFHCRYTPRLKEFASTLYSYSPKAYNFVRKTLNLPHEVTLRKWAAEISCESC